MKCMIPEISWHNREPVLCVDIQPIETEYYKLATGGSDCHLLIWQANILCNGAVAVDMIADLTRHQRAVNAVRWSPNGQYLASADDDANIIIWNVKTDNVPLLEGETGDKETWIVTKILRGHKEDIYDLSWSPNGMKLLSGSIDNTAIIWDFSKGKIETILSDHKAFVQGVAWDPKGQFIATLSSDRICRIFESNTKQIKARISKGTLPVPNTHVLYNKEVKYFHDDTFKSYYRRLHFSPDGNLIITPCGSIETDECKRALSATFIFTLDSLSQPAAVLPLMKQYSTAVRCCPVLFELRTDGPDPIINLPYRMLIAVATESDVILYDTQQCAPFAHFQRIHYTRLTDLTWSIDGRLLMASSTDGFCTFITFEANELGNEYNKEESEHDESVLNISGCEELADKKETALDDKPRKSNFLMKWAIQTPKKTICDDEPAKKRLKMDLEKEEKIETVDLTSPSKSKNRECEQNSYEELCSNIIDKGKLSNRNETKIIGLTSLIKINGKQEVTVKKITPIKLTEKQSSSKVATPIAVRRKPRNNDLNNHKNNDKSNPLLNFLKSGKTPGKPKRSSNTSNETLPITILDESEARDAWKCDDKQTADVIIHANTQPSESSTIPPDFTLQLEESTIGNEIIDDSAKSTVESKSTKGESSSKTTEKENSKVLTESKSDDTVKCISMKTGRRIPLITLSSPKTKKERHNT